MRRKSLKAGFKSVVLETVLFISMVLIISGTISETAFADNEVKVNVRKISPNVIVLDIDGLQATNVTAINSNKGIIVIDTETTPVFAAAIRKKIEDEFPGKKIIYLINTHDHPDHTYGNQVFADVPIIGQDKCMEEMKNMVTNASGLVKSIKASIPMMKKRLEQLEKGSDTAKSIEKSMNYYSAIADGLENGFEPTLPNITFSDKMTLYLGDISLQLEYYGYSHSKTDIVIFCPEGKLLVTGDIFYKESEPYFDTERIQNISKWKRVLGDIISRKDEIRFIVPGHGDLLPMAEVERFSNIINKRGVEFEGKESALIPFKEAYETDGLEPALKKLKDLVKKKDKYFILHGEFDTFTYRLMLNKKLNDALAIFTYLAELFPDKSNAFDSLGEVYLRLGEKEKALKNFKKSLEIDPENENAKAKIAELEKKN
jgi:cyclase